MLLQRALFRSFLWLSNIPLYICTTSSLSSVDGHLGCFHVLTIVNSAAKIFLAFTSDSTQALLTLPSTLPPSVYFPGECADILPFGVEFPEKDKLSTWVRNFRSGQWLVLPPPARSQLGSCQEQKFFQSPSLHLLPHDCQRWWWSLGPRSTPTGSSSRLGMFPQKISRNEGTCRRRKPKEWVNQDIILHVKWPFRINIFLQFY